jgi:hypothetical protein
MRAVPALYSGTVSAVGYLQIVLNFDGHSLNPRDSKICNPSKIM